VHALGPRELAALKASSVTAKVKVLNLRKVLAATVEAEVAAKPFLRPIGERAELLAQAYQEGQLSTQQALDEFLKLAQAAVDAETERGQLGLDTNAFAIYTALKPIDTDVAPEQARQLDALFCRNPDFRWNPDQENSLRTELYKALIPLVGRQKFIETTDALLRLERV
jgi:type I restriction enzyme, R subunit